ncbi:MAG: EamA family transporter [Planctomycetaceae bacterium]|nr:EamA family transporter [Planctomycetaceae bacterium]
MSHRRAVLSMVVVTLLWSSAGVVTRQLDEPRPFEITFWRSLFNGCALTVWMSATMGPGNLGRALLRAPRSLLLSGLCWSVMFTAFMLALTLTSVANVLVTMATGPLLTAIFARVALGHRLPRRTVIAIAVASLGIVWMYAAELGAGSTRDVLGMGVALLVTLAGATNWTLMQHTARVQGPGRIDLLPALLLGALLSSAAMLPLAWPLQSGGREIALLAGLGVFQLAIPCLLVVVVARYLSAPEVSLLSLLEVVFGVALVWLVVEEVPSSHTLWGGGLVLAALGGAELPAWWSRRALVPAAPRIQPGE